MKKELNRNSNGTTIVLSDVFPPQHGGSGKWLWELYQRLTDQKYVMVVGNQCGDDTRDIEYPHIIERTRLDMRHRGIMSLRSIISYADQIAKLFLKARHHRAHTIHAARPLSEGLIAAIVARACGMNFICFVHGEDVSVAKSSRELSATTAFVLRNANKIIANSNFSKQLLMNEWAIPCEKIAILHPGVNAEAFAAPAPEARTQDSLRLLTVGRLQPRKGQDTVIQAIPILKQRFPHIHYTIAGEGEDRPRLEKLCRDLRVSDHVTFLGAFSDEELPAIYQRHDIFVLANRSIGRDVEGFGIVLLEAQASGLPVIAGRSGGTSDTLVHSKTGFLINCNEPMSLADTITKHLYSAERRAEFGSLGRTHVLSNFDWAVLSNRAASLFGGNPDEHVSTE